MKYHKELQKFIKKGIDTNGDKAKWLELKHKGISATEIGILMGISPWGTAVDLFYDKTSPYEIKEEKFNVVMERGKYLEPLVVELYKQEYGGEIWHNNTNVLFQHPTRPFMIATPDCVCLHSEIQTIRYLECKTAAGRGSKKWYDGVPDYYLTQTQYGMNVLGIDQGCLSWLVDDIPGHMLIERDDGFVEAMEYVAETFMKEHIQKDIPPTPRTVSDFKQIYNEVVPDSCMMCTYELLKTFEEYETINQMINSYGDQIDGLKKRKDEIYMLIRKAIKDNERVIIDDDVLATLKKGKNGSRRLHIYNKILEKKKGLTS